MNELTRPRTQAVTQATPQPMVTRADRSQIKYVGIGAWSMLMLHAIDAAIVPGNQIHSRALLDRVSIQAANALASPLGKLEVQERVGRVVLVACEKATVQIDPVLPLVLLPLGSRYERAFCAYAQHISNYHTGRTWWTQARKLCNRVIRELVKVADRLTRVELAYLVIKIQTLLAWPVGEETTL